MKKLILSKKQVIFFIIAGGVSAVIEILMMKLFSLHIPKLFSQEENFYGFAYPLSNILSTCVAILCNYIMSVWFVFEGGKHSRKKEFAYFISFSIFSTFLSLTIFQLLYHYIFLSPLDLGFFTFSEIIMSKAFAIVIVSILNYMVKKRFIFNG